MPGFSAGPALFTSIAIDGGGTICWFIWILLMNIKATVMKFDGSNWVTVGSAGFSAWRSCLHWDSNRYEAITPFVVYQDFGHVSWW